MTLKKTPCIFVLLNADALEGIAIPARVFASDSVSSFKTVSRLLMSMPRRASRCPPGYWRPIVYHAVAKNVPKCTQRTFVSMFLIVFATIRKLPLCCFPPGYQLLGTSFQKARRAFWGEARPGFGVHWCVYTNGHRSPFGLRDARKGIGV